ncbi:hypothetical protein VP1G_10863 [Cytospora mali]|uniref:Uncharacterized protein n=1 Tax=Cytospora mali TaxID=578113 RepID=A0A194UY57_CYTMA|nr:hypothetical protein VP1G_10863 [Valsa mali var. pyri (nom. inval.)]
MQLTESTRADRELVHEYQCLQEQTRLPKPLFKARLAALRNMGPCSDQRRCHLWLHGQLWKNNDFVVVLFPSDNLLKSLLDRLRGVNELLQVVIQVCQVLPAFLVLGDELLLALQQLLALLLQALALGSLVLDPGDHECVLVGSNVLWVLGEELLDGNKRKFLVLVTIFISHRRERKEGRVNNVLEALTSSDLALQVPLFVVQILQLQVQHVDLLPRLGGLRLGVAGAEARGAVQAAQRRGVGEAVGEAEGLLARVLRCLEERAQGRVRHDCVDGHGGMRDGLGRQGADRAAGLLLMLSVLMGSSGSVCRMFALWW